MVLASSAVIRMAHAQDFSIIREIAIAAWKVAYQNIVSPEFMVHEWEREYSETALQSQIHVLGHQFLILEDEAQQAVGFSSYCVEGSVAKVQKLYLQPNLKGKGYGAVLMTQVEANVRELGCESVELNVNRFNTAVQFYQKQGYSIIREIDTVVGDGFMRNDYVMGKSLQRL